jgi:retinol dehydrogenase-12
LKSPSKFVLSAEGKEIQKKLWNETIALFQKEAPAAKIDSILP